jgi:hypothetical protein
MKNSNKIVEIRESPDFAHPYMLASKTGQNRVGKNKF